MKKITALIIAVFFIFALVACNGGEEDTSATVYPSRTAAFYGNMDKSSFYFKMSFTNNGATYGFTQATNGRVVTTIEDHEDNSLDKYHIFNGDCIHKLDFSDRSYDTLITTDGQQFLFGGYEPEMFARPSLKSVEQFEGNSYYCESFSTVSQSGGAISGKNRYFFDGNTLKVIEIVENGKTVMVMRLEEYGNTLPDSLCLAPPSDFRADTLEMEQSGGINFSEVWGDISFDE